MLEFVTETRVDLARSGARFGEGCFETLRIQDGTPRWLNLHHDRLAEGCARVGLEPPPSLETLREGLAPLCAGRARGVLRILAVDRRLIAWADEAPPEPGAPVRIGLSRLVTRWSGNPWLRVKTLAQLDNRCLQQEAASRGLAEVIAANERGRLTDGGRFNLVALVGGRLVTPPTAEGALPGIARRVLVEAGLLEEATLSWDDLRRAEALALVNALRGLWPVAEAEGLGTFPIGHPGLADPAEVLA